MLQTQTLHHYKLSKHVLIPPPETNTCHAAEELDNDDEEVVDGDGEDPEPGLEAEALSKNSHFSAPFLGDFSRAKQLN